MLKRLSYAVLGASAITFGLILMMSRIAEFFEERDSQVYMRVMDFIPGSGARRLPDKRMPEAQPDRARLETGEIPADQPAGLTAPVDFDQNPEEIEVRVDLDTEPGN